MRLRAAVGSLDRELFRRVATRDTAVLDAVLPPLSRAADHSVLWIAVAAVLQAVPDRRLQRAGRRGLAAIAVASLLANQVGKRVLPRARPLLDDVPLVRRVRMPGSTSFPSGHAASAAAFAVGVGLEAPELALPLGVTAAAVGFSRVYTGVHYPVDVAVGAALGAGVALTLHRLLPAATSAAAAARRRGGRRRAG
jgi:undecaprenyl-diphosphatase